MKQLKLIYEGFCAGCVIAAVVLFIPGTLLEDINMIFFSGLFGAASCIFYALSRHVDFYNQLKNKDKNGKISL